MEKKTVKKNHGRSICHFAGIVELVLVISSLVSGFSVGFVLGQLLHEFTYTTIIGFVIVIVGCVIAHVIASFLFGFGEMVENTAEIATAIEVFCEKNGVGLDSSVDIS